MIRLAETTFAEYRQGHFSSITLVLADTYSSNCYYSLNTSSEPSVSKVLKFSPKPHRVCGCIHFPSIFM